MAAASAATGTKVVLAWGKQNLEVPIESNVTLQEFQEYIESLTGVVVARQKFILKGKKIQTDEDVRQLLPGTKIIMMGVATELPKPPKEKILFMEDMSAAELAEVGVRLGVGLQNLGNTCYMNSTLQCLKGVPELRSALVAYSKQQANQPLPQQGANISPILTRLLGQLFDRLDASEDAIVPASFTTAFRAAFPQFDEKDAAGRHKQQDAEEAFSQLVTVLADHLRSTDDIPVGAVVARPDPANLYLRADNVVDQLFGGQLEVVERCLEAPEEPIRHSKESFRRLQCHIGVETNFIFQGLEQQLKEQREKQSPSLERNALYERSSRISALPPYLVVQFVRFCWRADTNSKAKICRRVRFPAELDMLPFASDDLKSALTSARKLNVAREDERLGLGDKKAEQTAAAAAADPNCMQVDEDEGDSNGSAAPQVELPAHPVTSGMYRLTAAVTHQGRMADSGHYVGWVRQDDGSDDWLMYDDAKVKPVKESDVLQLDGASVDWHISYLVIYQRTDDMTEEGQKLKEEKRKRDEETRLAKRLQ